MEFDEISEIIFGQLTPKLESNQGVSIFAKERAKFEGWLKVELCDSLLKYYQVVPENNRVDITFNGWAIELKTVNTNIRYENVKKGKAEGQVYTFDNILFRNKSQGSKCRR